MKWLFQMLCLAVCMCPVLAYDLLRDGAVADVRFKVIDDLGSPVEGALATICFQRTFEKSEVVMCKTDEEGACAAKHVTIGGLRVYFEKDGYYETSIQPSFRQWDWRKAQETRKWSEHTMESTICLKKKRMTIQTVLHSVDFKPFPDTNVVVKLDLETLAWCPPYGNGRHDDLHLVFDGWRNPNDWDDFHEHLKVEMPNGADGFYVAKTEPASAFKYAYAADTNATYRKSLAFRHVHKAEGITESKRLAADEYLIYRVRTQTNELGQVTRANYGRIGEKFSQYIGLSIKSWFNPNVNDTNLEDARPCAW